MAATDDLLRRNAAYAEGFDKGSLTPAPAKKVAIITCMDARIDVGRILGLEEGDAHVIRNAGGLPTDDAIRSLLISQRVLGTQEVMLIQHTDCGMTSLDEDELRKEIEDEAGTGPPFPLGTFADLENNVRRSVDQIRNSPFLRHRNSVRGFIYDVRSGRLQEVQRDR